MSSIAVTASATGTGTVSLVAPVTNSDRTVTLPDNTGTVVTTGSTAVVSQGMLATNVAGNGPAFGAYAGATTSVTNATMTKVLFNTEEFDTASCFASSTFTPNVAGYYQINATIIFSGGTTTGIYFITLFKNGSEFKRGNQNAATTNDTLATVGSIIYFNGTTDYLDVYAFQNSGVTKTLGLGSAITYVNGAMVRSA